MMTVNHKNILLLALSIFVAQWSALESFSIHSSDVRAWPFCCYKSAPAGRGIKRCCHTPFSSLQSAKNGNEESLPPPPQPSPAVVVGAVAPLQYRGPYPCLGLHFPMLEKEQPPTTMTTFEFVLDTGANVNSIPADLAAQYQIPRLDNSQNSASADVPMVSVGMGGSLEEDSGNLVLLGDCSLAGFPPSQNQIIFLKQLTASVLPQNPASKSSFGATRKKATAAGILGTPFIESFAAVEFDWYGTDGDPPTFCFYFGGLDDGLSEETTRGMTRVPLQKLFQLLTLQVEMNGVRLPVLLDTGSPITLLSEEAAEKAGTEKIVDPSSTKDDGKATTTASTLPPTKIGDPFLMIAGVDGRPIKVVRSESPSVPIQVGGMSLGEGPVYIVDDADVTALSFLKTAANLVQKEAPVAILGLDVLKRAHRVILKTSGCFCEMWLDEMDDSKPMYQESAKVPWKLEGKPVLLLFKVVFFGQHTKRIKIKGRTQTSSCGSQTGRRRHPSSESLWHRFQCLCCLLGRFINASCGCSVWHLMGDFYFVKHLRLVERYCAEPCSFLHVSTANYKSNGYFS